jgi:hypothetical protein
MWFSWFRRKPAAPNDERVVDVTPGVGVGDLKLGAACETLRTAEGAAVHRHGATDIEPGLVVQCFDGVVYNVCLYTGVEGGRVKAPVQRFAAVARLAGGPALSSPIEELLRTRPPPSTDSLESFHAIPIRTITWSDGLRIDVRADTGTPTSVLVFDPDKTKPLARRMAVHDRVVAAVWRHDGEAIEGLWDQVKRLDLARPLAAEYPGLTGWETRAHLVAAVSETTAPEWRRHFLHFLQAPVDERHGAIHVALANVVCHFDGDPGRFHEYWDDEAVLQERAATLFAQHGGAAN